MAEKDQEQQPQAASEPEAPVAPVPDEETEQQPAGSEPVDVPAAEPAEPAEEEPEDETAQAVVAEEAAVADAEPAPDVEAVAAASEAPEPAEAPKEVRRKKRLPRAQRHKHTKPTRERPAERRPITRTPKPESERGRRQERRGVVVSSGMDKTIVVKVDTIKAHPRYKKVVRRSTKLHAHDEANEAKVGDVVRVVETRPLSKTKYWRLVEVVEAAK